MVLDSKERFIIASTGWVEHGGLVRRDVQTGEFVRCASDGSDYLRLYEVDASRFMTAGHTPERDLITFSVRTFDAPDLVLWSLVVTPKSQTASGDPAAAKGIRSHHLATFKNGGRWDSHLVTVHPDGRGASLGELPWYNGQEYDLGYQGLVDVVPLPGTAMVLISVQRSSNVVVHDPVQGRKVESFGLAGCHGNPMLRIVGNELWTVDYDTFVRVDLTTRRCPDPIRVPTSDYSFRGPNHRI